MSRIIRVKSCIACDRQCLAGANYAFAGGRGIYDNCHLESGETVPYWRKYPEEKPRNTDWIVARTGVSHCVIRYDDCYENIYRFSHWIPIPDFTKRGE